MSVVYYTPGHGLIADALIMHGVVRLCASAGAYEGEVVRVGEGFEIRTDCNARGADVLQYLARLAGLYLSRGVVAGLLEKLAATNVNPGAFKAWVTSLSEALGEFDLSTYMRRDHKQVQKEGRSKSKRLHTLYISLSSTYGKYVQEDMKVVDKQYGVCDTCFLTANLGLVFGATAVVHREWDQLDVIFMSPVPAERADFYDVLTIQRLTERYGETRKEMPTLAAPIYWLSTGETLYAVESPMELIVWRTSKKGSFIRSQEASTINLTKLMDFIAEMKREEPQWPKIVKDLAEDEPEILADLAEYVLFGGDPYKVVRELAMWNMKRRNWYNVDRITKVILEGVKI
ncbi:CRISPR-associated protein (Cas_Csa4) [Pyrobaculum oguniense TE7]|uniref:CRISPR-associated protein (Cas_Csa4) n=1 Tax=Pyrobaculum oguniense (strain DSM 13380 / JCM 10595 / TE7) TaxID=698757 RepID=H6QA48_PYROT|nr:CRISPR-associated protein (Cas_Csa4) [Pyrobaculum oguniense TE7]